MCLFEQTLINFLKVLFRFFGYCCGFLYVMDNLPDPILLDCLLYASNVHNSIRYLGKKRYRRMTDRKRKLHQIDENWRLVCRRWNDIYLSEWYQYKKKKLLDKIMDKRYVFGYVLTNKMFLETHHFKEQMHICKLSPEKLITKIITYLYPNEFIGISNAIWGTSFTENFININMQFSVCSNKRINKNLFDPFVSWVIYIMKMYTSEDMQDHFRAKAFYKKNKYNIYKILLVLGKDAQSIWDTCDLNTKLGILVYCFMRCELLPDYVYIEIF